jgi:bisphosphoglycerate-independent phosphoglycerate mutase (AlkP superfamily)
MTLPLLEPSEQEKAAHVTYYMRGKLNEAFSEEVVDIVPSPNVPSYDMQPEMNATQVTDVALAMIHSKDKYTVQYGKDPFNQGVGIGEVQRLTKKNRFIRVNYPNLDLVGHLDFEAAKLAVDNELKRLVPELIKQRYRLVVTADHGNSEYMKTPEGISWKAHTNFPVPFIYIDPDNKDVKLREGAPLYRTPATLFHAGGLSDQIPESWAQSIIEGDIKPPAVGEPVKLALIVVDGMGWNPDRNYPYDATRGNMPYLMELMDQYPHTLVDTAGEAVGLREKSFYTDEKTMGNSEVGHGALGNGRENAEAILRIDRLIQPNGTFGDNSGGIIEAIRAAKSQGKPLHLISMASEGEVHSSDYHLRAVLRTAAAEGLQDVYVHPILDGRDTPDYSSIEFMNATEQVMQETGVGKFVDVVGRVYAMDKARVWKRTQLVHAMWMANQLAQYPNWAQGQSVLGDGLVSEQANTLADKLSQAKAVLAHTSIDSSAQRRLDRTMSRANNQSPLRQVVYGSLVDSETAVDSTATILVVSDQVMETPEGVSEWSVLNSLFGAGNLYTTSHFLETFSTGDITASRALFVVESEEQSLIAKAMGFFSDILIGQWFSAHPFSQVQFRSYDGSVLEVLTGVTGTLGEQVEFLNSLVDEMVESITTGQSA